MSSGEVWMLVGLCVGFFVAGLGVGVLVMAYLVERDTRW